MPSKSILRIAFDIVIALGALACILVWLEIKPKDLWSMSPPHVLWLVGALGLFVFSVGTSVHNFMRQQRKSEGLAHHKVAGGLPNFETISADWGNEHDKRPVLNTIRLMPRNGLVFHVSPSSFRPYDPDSADAAPGVDDKEVAITYQFPGCPRSTVRRKQGQWVVLPEDTILKSQAERATGLETQLKVLEQALAKSRQDLLVERANATAASLGPEDNLGGIDDRIFSLIRNSYPQAWAQRVALKRIWGRESITETELTEGLERDGFRDANAQIVKPVIRNKALVEYGEKLGEAVIWIKNSEARRILAALFKESPLC